MAKYRACERDKSFGHLAKEMTYKWWMNIKVGRVVPLCSDQGRNVHRRAEDACKCLSTVRLVLLCRKIGSQTRRLHIACLIKILSRDGGMGGTLGMTFFCVWLYAYSRLEFEAH